MKKILAIGIIMLLALMISGIVAAKTEVNTIMGGTDLTKPLSGEGSYKVDGTLGTSGSFTASSLPANSVWGPHGEPILMSYRMPGRQFRLHPAGWISFGLTSVQVETEMEANVAKINAAAQTTVINPNIARTSAVTQSVTNGIDQIYMVSGLGPVSAMSYKRYNTGQIYTNGLFVENEVDIMFNAGTYWWSNTGSGWITNNGVTVDTGTRDLTSVGLHELLQAAGNIVDRTDTGIMGPDRPMAPGERLITIEARDAHTMKDLYSGLYNPEIPSAPPVFHMKTADNVDMYVPQLTAINGNSQLNWEYVETIR